MGFEVEKTEEQWRQELSEFEYHVLREKGTERAHTGELLNEDRIGTFACKGCGAELFKSETKFDSHCGWPSFYEPKVGDAVELIEDRSHGMVRTEVLCAKCGSHLGHVFPDGPKEKGGSRYCTNSSALRFIPKLTTGRTSYGIISTGSDPWAAIRDDDSLAFSFLVAPQAYSAH